MVAVAQLVEQGLVPGGVGPDEARRRRPQLLALGEHDKAEEPLRRALDIWEDQLGSTTHPLLSTVVNKFALLLRNLGNFQESELYYRRAIAICKEQLGEEHGDYANALRNLASLYELVHSRRHECEPLYRKVLRIREAENGADDPSVAGALLDLGRSLLVQDRFAEPILRRALKIRERRGGHDTLEVAETLDALATARSKSSDVESALSLYGRAIEIKEKLLGPDDVAVASSVHNLAELHKRRRDYDAARPLFERALRIGRAKLAPDSTPLATTMANYARCLEKQGDHAAAEGLLAEALASREKDAKGRADVAVAKTSFALGAVLEAQDKLAKAEERYRACLAIYEDVLGDKDVRVATCLTALGRVLKRQPRRRDETVAVYRRALKIREKKQGTDHLDVAYCYDHLGAMLRGAGNYAEAAPLYLAAARIREKRLGPEDPLTVKTARNYRRVVRKRDRPPSAGSSRPGSPLSDDESSVASSSSRSTASGSPDKGLRSTAKRKALWAFAKARTKGANAFSKKRAPEPALGALGAIVEKGEDPAAPEPAARASARRGSVQRLFGRSLKMMMHGAKVAAGAKRPPRPVAAGFGGGAKRATAQRGFGATWRAKVKAPAGARPAGAGTILANKHARGVRAGGRAFAGQDVRSHGAHSGENFA